MARARLTSMSSMRTNPNQLYPGAAETAGAAGTAEKKNRRKSIIDIVKLAAVMATDHDMEDVEPPAPRYKPGGIESLCFSTKFTRREIQLLYRGFKQECPTGIVNKETFRNIYQQYFPQGNSSQYAQYVFNTFDQEKEGSINFEEFLSALSILSRGSIEEKLQWAFTLYDINNDGHITRQEMLDIAASIYEMMGKCVYPPVDDIVICQHVDEVFDKMDLNQDGIISYDEFMKSCHQNDDIMKSLGFMDTVMY